jgi:hypothetical protein
MPNAELNWPKNRGEEVEEKERFSRRRNEDHAFG